jgi:hypothetical protein
LLCIQMFAPTTLAPARDFWTLRYTTTMEDGSLVVCIIVNLLLLLVSKHGNLAELNYFHC